MKFIWFFSLFLIIYSASGQSPADSSLVLYYTFDGNALDSGIYQNDPTFNSAVAARDRFGADSSAYFFDGSSGYVQIPNSPSLSSPDSQITQLAWIYMHGWSKTGDDFNPILMKSSSGTNAFHYRMSIGTGGFGVAFNNWNNGRGASYDFQFFRWYMVAVTFARDTLHFYVDGDLILSEPFATTLQADTRPLEIGRDVPGITEHFFGRIDEVRVYNRALTSQEISTLYDTYHKDKRFSKVHIMPDSMMNSNNHGMAWEDYDQDGDLDLFLARYSFPNAVFLNNGDGSFELDTLFFTDDEAAASNAAGWADVDNDQDVDLFVANWNAPNRLYLNDGEGNLTRSEDTVLSALSRSSSDFDWADYDQDGYIDIFVANRDEPNSLYHNNGDGTFSRVDTGRIATDDRSSISCRWIDYDDDGDPDMYVTNTFNENNFLYSNDGAGVFTRIDTLTISTDGQHGASNSWSDFDNDGDMDLFVSHANYGDNNYIYENLGQGQFELMANVPMRSDGRVSAGADWGDMDNDGLEDLALGNGGWYTAQKNLLYHNKGNGDFEIVLDDTFVTEAAQSEAVTMVDWDNDGHLELAVANRDRRNFYYDNTSDSDNNWISMTFRGTVSNRSAIGTKVRLRSMFNGAPVWQMRYVATHNARRSHSGLDVHFGLGKGTMVDSLVINWPSGVDEVYTNISDINQKIIVTENEGITGLKQNNAANKVVRDFQLAQNYPNPFNPATTIKFQIPAAAFTTLKIYNLLGQKVATVASENLPQGYHSFSFDGSKLASGVYYYQLLSGDHKAVKKMVLLK